jgi:hypothetical protein
VSPNHPTGSSSARLVRCRRSSTRGGHRGTTSSRCHDRTRASRRRPSKLPRSVQSRLGIRRSAWTRSLGVDVKRRQRLSPQSSRRGSITSSRSAENRRCSMITSDSVSCSSGENEKHSASGWPVREIVKRLGDGFLLACPSAPQAIRGALAVKAAVDRRQTRVRAVGEDRGSRRRAPRRGHAREPHCPPPGSREAGKVLVCEAAKELAGGRLRTVCSHTANSLKIRAWPAR